MNLLLTTLFINILLFRICFVFNRRPKKKSISSQPLTKQDITQDELYDADYVMLSTAIDKAQNYFQIRMAKCAVKQFKQRYKSCKNKAILDYDVDELLDQCEIQLFLINSFPKI